MAEEINLGLLDQGFRPIIAASGEEGLAEAFTQLPSLILLDLILPGMDGFDVCRRLRQEEATRAVPVMIVSGRNSEADIIAGLELGADDYLTKPFAMRVLISRVRTLLRRAHGDGDQSHAEPLILDGLAINPGHHEVRINNHRVTLTPSEFGILNLLARHPGHVFDRGEILSRIRDGSPGGSERAIDVQMVGLRKRLGNYGKRIETVRGVGYRYNASTGDRSV